MGIIQNPLLDAFRAVAELGTVHAGAKRLGLTQTAATKRLKALEESLSATLFLRSRRGMKLTEEGRSLLKYCRAVEELEGAFLGGLAGSRNAEPSVTLVGPTSAISTRVAADCLPLYEKHPRLRLHLRSDDHSNLIELVRKGIADLAIVSPGEVPLEMASKLLKPDRYWLVASRRWKNRPLAEILREERIVDFYESDQMTKRYLEKFGLRASRLGDRIYVNENEALVRCFAEGVGFGVLTEAVAKAPVEAGAIVALNRGRALEDPLALTWYPRPQMAPWFLDLTRSIR